MPEYRSTGHPIAKAFLPHQRVTTEGKGMGLSIKFSPVLVPEWINYVAVDKDGDCWGYENVPKAEVQSWCVSFPFGGRVEFLCHVQHKNWRHSLIKILRPLMNNPKNLTA